MKLLIESRSKLKYVPRGLGELDNNTIVNYKLKSVSAIPSILKIT